MSGKMLVATETLRSIVETRSPEQIVADRIARRVLRAARRGDIDIPVRGHVLPVGNTQHEPAVYADATAQLLEAGVEVEIHQFEERRERAWGGVGFAAAYRWEEPVDTVVVKAVDGDPRYRERLPQTASNHLARVYPPEEPFAPLPAAQV